MVIGKIPNFSEYGLKGDFTSFNLQNAFSTSFTPNIQRLHQNFLAHSRGRLIWNIN